MNPWSVLSWLLLGSGFFFILSGIVGVLRLPDFYTRLHAQGKCDTLGVALMLGGLAVREGPTLNALKILLILFFILWANPTATHALGRSAYLWGLKPWRSGEERR